MKRKYIIPVMASLLALGACDYNEDNFEGLEEMTRPTNVFKKDYTLTEADYSTIANNSTNKSLASEAGLAGELSALKTSLTFTDELPGTVYIPAFLAATWYTGDDGSAIKVTYNQKKASTATEKAINAALIYAVSNDDYTAAWGGAKNTFFTPTESASKHVPGILKAEYPDAADGDIVLVDYNYSEEEPSGEQPALNEGFDGQTSNETVEIAGWHNVTTVGTYTWQAKSYSGNFYMQQSAYKHAAGELESYMITPAVAIESGMKLTFDACYGNYKAEGGRLTLLYSENLAGFTKEDIAAATWVDITDAVEIPVPTGTYGTLANVCDYDLSALAGKSVYFAFRYNGNSTDATTTVQVDNIVVKKAAGTSDLKSVKVSDLFQFNGSEWDLFTGALSLDEADYQAMGSNYGNLDDSMSPDTYLPAYLSQQYPYAQEEDQYTVAYKYYANKQTNVQCATYTMLGGQWTPAAQQVLTNQFVLNGGKWNYDPSTVINLPVEKGNAEVAAFYQAITDWVKENYPEYVTGYGNNDYYYGGSAYQNNFDFRVSAWKGQGTYNDMSDADIEKLMWERLPEAFPHALEALYGSVAPVEGIDVIYTINFGIYDGSSTTTWTIQYKVVAVGKFEYVADSLKKVE